MINHVTPTWKTNPYRERLLAVVVARMKSEILDDYRAGRFNGKRPASYSRLHDFVDANEYGGACEDDAPANPYPFPEGEVPSPARDEHMEFWGEAQEIVHRWLACSVHDWTAGINVNC
jgi:hypothetical protein